MTNNELNQVIQAVAAGKRVTFNGDLLLKIDLIGDRYMAVGQHSTGQLDNQPFNLIKIKEVSGG